MFHSGSRHKIQRSEAKSLAQENEFEAAHNSIDDLEQRIKRILGGTSEADDAAQFMARLKSLVPQLKEAQQSKTSVTDDPAAQFLKRLKEMLPALKPSYAVVSRRRIETASEPSEGVCQKRNDTMMQTQRSTCSAT
ncbi:MAG: hypothetical protein AAGG48_27630 [Planctomycetota bacterium]